MLDVFDKLDTEECNHLKNIISLGGKIDSYLTTRVKGVDHLKNLRVNLNGSTIQGLSFQHLQELTIDNAIIGANGFYFPRLDDCRIYNSQLPVNPEFLNLHKKITWLIIEHCNLTTIPKLNNVKYLRLLRLSNNYINSIKSLHKDICCENIQKIDLSYNKISDLHDFKQFSYFSKIRDINLSFNSIKSVNIIYQVPKLTNLDLSNNNISKINAIKNLPSLKRIDLSNSVFDNNFEYNKNNNNNRKNNISHLENLSNLPKLEILEITGNPISHIYGIEYLRNIKRIGLIHLKFCTKKQVEEMFNYIHEIELGIDDEDRSNIYISGPFPKYSFKINEHIKLILIKNLNNNKYETKLLVNNENFIQCRHLFIIPTLERADENLKSSIDDFSNELNYSTKSIKPEDIDLLKPEEEFWGHCSNLQAWYEHNYDTRLLHRSIAFPLLYKLTEVGDAIAKKVFKEEIAKRYTSGNKNVQEFLKNEGYLNYLTKLEFEYLKKE